MGDFFKILLRLKDENVLCQKRKKKYQRKDIEFFIKQVFNSNDIKDT